MKNSEDFSSRRIVDLLWKGNQLFSKGITPVSKVETVFEELNKHRVEGIRFNRDKIKNEWKSDTAMAMALDFAQQFLTKSQAFGNDPKIEDYSLCILGLRHRCQRLNKQMRIRQNAFNTLEFIKGSNRIDFEFSKMQSLAGYHSLKLENVSTGFKPNAIALGVTWGMFYRKNYTSKKKTG